MKMRLKLYSDRRPKRRLKLKPMMLMLMFMMMRRCYIVSYDDDNDDVGNPIRQFRGMTLILLKI